MKDRINITIMDNGNLKIFLGDCLLTTITNGRTDEAFIEDVLNGMGYIWNTDGTVTKMENKELLEDLWNEQREQM